MALESSWVSTGLRQYLGLVLDESTLCKERGGHSVGVEGTQGLANTPDLFAVEVSSINRSNETHFKSG